MTPSTLGDDLHQGPPFVKLTTFQDPEKQRQPLFRWLWVPHDHYGLNSRAGDSDTLGKAFSAGSLELRESSGWFC